MDPDEATLRIADLANNFAQLVRELAPTWRTAYLRFCWQGTVTGAKASYVHDHGVEIVDVTRHKAFFHPLAHTGRDVLTALGKTEGLFLLVVDSSRGADYELLFEHQDLARWKISKLGGSTGVPVGLRFPSSLTRS